MSNSHVHFLLLVALSLATKTAQEAAGELDARLLRLLEPDESARHMLERAHASGPLLFEGLRALHDRSEGRCRPR